MPIAHLDHRSVIHISGDDAATLLQSLITNDIELATSENIIFSAMLAPQGKWLFDFFISTHPGGGYLIDIDASLKERFLKTLKMYKLRANVEIEDASDDYHIIAGWDSTPPEGALPDPRLDRLGWRMTNKEPAEYDTNAPDYNAHRLSLGVPQGVLDAGDRSFPMDLGYDVLNGISFSKGCYIGQEVTARMHYKHIMRKAFYLIKTAEGTELPDFGTPVMAGDTELGDMRSHHHNIGLAMLKIDATEKAAKSKASIRVDDIDVAIEMAPWLREKWQRIQSLESDQ